jgi:hypothetical protein
MSQQNTPDNCTHNCDTCIENHYFKHDTKDCAFSKDPTVDEYFGNKTAHYLERNPTDDKLSVWKPCHTTCQTCSNGLDGDNHNCDSCITGHKFIYGTKNCVDQPPQYYYDDTSSIYFMPCHESCETCKGSEREDCIMCRYTDLYYPTEETLSDDTKRCYNGSKDHDNSPGDDYYLDKNENELDRLKKEINDIKYSLSRMVADIFRKMEDLYYSEEKCSDDIIDNPMELSRKL